jgi:hypothetical protein
VTFKTKRMQLLNEQVNVGVTSLNILSYLRTIKSLSNSVVDNGGAEAKRRGSRKVPTSTTFRLLAVEVGFLHGSSTAHLLQKYASLIK